MTCEKKKKKKKETDKYFLNNHVMVPRKYSDVIRVIFKSSFS